MAIEKLSLKTLPLHKGKRLDQVLAEWLPQATGEPHFSKGKVRKLIVAGAVYLNGKRVRIASKPVQLGAKIEVFLDREKLKNSVSSAPRNLADADILYEDESLILVNKPPGLPTQPTLDEARDNLFAAVKRYLKSKGASDPYVGLHHRLDRDTSGVLLLTKRPEANAGIAKQFSTHEIQKVYQALTSFPLDGKKPEKNWRVKNYLRKVSEGKKAKWGSVRSGGDYADTDFVLLESFSEGLLVQAMPHTGRTHQIRVHLSEMGLPILGDKTYGGSPAADRVMLHAFSLTFIHPITNLKISVESPIPEDFEQCRQALSRGSKKTVRS
ncbi:RluA family pseudouridine synthase [bacterium]|nr:RluA family pseudouridine synthase [bacterium]